MPRSTRPEGAAKSRSGPERRATLSAESTGQIVEVLPGDVDRRVRLQIGLALRSVFQRPGDEGGPQADALCGPEVAEVRRDHHDLVDLQVENVGRGLVHLAIGFVVANELGSQDAG